MTMERRAWVATRKGLFEMRRRAGSWAIERVSFLGLYGTAARFSQDLPDFPWGFTAAEIEARRSWLAVRSPT